MEVVARINEIESYINTYMSLKSQISSLADSLMNSATNLLFSYNVFTEALIIGDVDYNNSIKKVEGTSNSLKNTANSLYSLIGKIDNEILTLSEEKNSLEPKRTYKVFVEE